MFPPSTDFLKKFKIRSAIKIPNDLKKKKKQRKKKRTEI